MVNVMQAGNIVRSSYGTGPYFIKDVIGPCRCQNSKPHFHALCKGTKEYGDGETFYLNGFRQDGSSVWSEDFLIVAKPADQISFSF